MPREHDVSDETALTVPAVDSPASELDLLSTREMAQALGISPSTLKRKVQAGELPAMRDGHKLRFRRTESIEIGPTRQRSTAVEREAREGQIAAASFARFRAGMAVEQVVEEVAAPPQLVMRLFREWSACCELTRQWQQAAPATPAAVKFDHEAKPGCCAGHEALARLETR